MEEGLTSLSDTITCIVVISLLSTEVWNNETMFTNEGGLLVTFSWRIC